MTLATPFSRPVSEYCGFDGGTVAADFPAAARDCDKL
jgi:hypothetical protein